MYDFGLSVHDFWRLTPAQFAAIGKRYDVDLDRAHIGFAQLCAITCNIHRNPKKQRKQFQVADFMPQRGAPAQPVRKSPAQLLEYWKTRVLPHFNVIDKRTGGVTNDDQNHSRT